MLEIDNLSVAYGPVQALRGVSMTIGVNQFVSIIGPNGAGKTTLLKSICNALPWQGGDIRIDGRSIRGRAPWDIARMGIAHVPEGRRVFGQMTVEENLKVGGMRRTLDRTRLDDVYELFPRLRALQARRAITMSGGEQQMLAIGRALMSKPRLLMLDEPSMGLAPLLVEQVFHHITELFRASALSVLLIEQRVTEALEASQRSYVLEQGRVAMQGDAAALLNSEDIQRAYLGLSATS
ncbi:MAG: ABC transporter ATP-binding protein [Acetobacteraceae bacterium]